MLSSSHIHFNPFKHHLAFVCLELLNLAGETEAVKTEMLEKVKAINANLVDIYTGELLPSEIEELIALFLNETHITLESEFVHWLGTSGYRLITLADQSVWIVRKSIYKEAFVHIHPSRQHAMVIRVHGNAWKTVLGLLIVYPEFLENFPSLEQINTFRKTRLNLSPMKRNVGMERILKVYKLIREKLTTLV